MKKLTVLMRNVNNHIANNKGASNSALTEQASTNKHMMHLKLLLPFEVFIDNQHVTQIIAETTQGSYGFLPHRLDCIAALTPGILTFTTENEGEVFVAIDQGILVKTGLNVLVSVRSAKRDNNLAKLRAAVQEDFMAIDEQEQQVRTVMNKLEIGFLHKLSDFHKQ